MYGAQMLSRRSGKRHRGTVCRGIVARGPVIALVSLDNSLSSEISLAKDGGSSSSSSVPSVSSSAAHDVCIEREKNKFIGFMTSFASQCGVQLDSLPTLFPSFPPMDDLNIPQLLTSPPSSSSQPPPT
ncbi:hypothetical protein M9H77_17601 [Catharanthus roseus]|uniref:Uncharacterized protein n=1 Tax=Catharanthus roseus TaxID=4058 RepID=A0ACC0B5E9_CATRO|nr:hypothetical protein M9H77_17601 [Catharanthus roseus]